MLVLILILTVVINLFFIIDTAKKVKDSIESKLPKNSRSRVARLSAGREEADEDDVADDEDDDSLASDHRLIGDRKVTLNVTSSKALVSVVVADVQVLNDSEKRGIHVLVLHQATASVMAKRTFDTYESHEDDALILFLNMISPGRILIFTILDEGSFQLKKPAKELLSTQFASSLIHSLGWRDSWVFATVKGAPQSHSVQLGEVLTKSPSLSEWAEPAKLSLELVLVNHSLTDCKHWRNDAENQRRRSFCEKIEGYGSVCSCTDPAPITLSPDPIPDLQVGIRIAAIPIIVIASNRPHYLYRMLRALLSASGVHPSQVVVFVDGYFEEPIEVAKLFGLKGIQHTPSGLKNARISQHYKSSFKTIFDDLFPKAGFTFVLEEDLDISPDIFYYFGQLLPVYESDPSVYCISAWNDQGYEHSCGDPSLVTRVETMPGLGWVLKRSLFKNELEPNWPTPEQQWDWDMWMRLPTVRKGRECLIPDVSRTYHFGSKGLNMNPYFQEIYFKKHSMNTLPNIVLINLDKLSNESYEIHTTQLISGGNLVDHSKNPCEVPIEDMFQKDSIDSASKTKRDKSSKRSNVMYISMQHDQDFETWKSLSKCLHIWDLDIRGTHKASWRLYMSGAPLFIVGVPASPYAKLKPDSIKPIFIPQPTEASPAAA